MKTYQIENTFSGIILGHYQAASESEALDLMAHDAGYISYADLEKQFPPEEGEIKVSAVEE